ncbi:MAG: hypothetical protein GXO07_02660 [Crenarchaeota archaeon]|nr:hypothetical protein [Thermoproteota archaeon]
MRRAIALLLMIGLVFAKVDVRVVTTDQNPQQSQAYVALVTFVKERPEALKYVPPPSQWSVGPAVTSPPNPDEFNGVLLVFDNKATTGNITRDKILAKTYVNKVIIPALKDGMRVALIVGPYSDIGQQVLLRLGLFVPTVLVNETGRIEPACLSGVKPIQPNPADHPIYSNISALPSSCCMVPLVPDVVGDGSLGSRGKYCVVLRLTKLGDEVIIMSWKGIFRDISTNPNVQELLLNVLKYLDGAYPARYPKKPYTVTVTTTATVTTTTTITNNITIIMTTTSTYTTTVITTSTVTTTVTETLTKVITSYINVTKTVTTTLYNTVTTTVTDVVTTTINNTITLTSTLTTTVTTTLLKTFYSTITTTTTVVKREANVTMLAGALLAGLIAGAAAIAVLMNRGGRSSRSPLEEW